MITKLQMMELEASDLMGQGKVPASVGARIDLGEAHTSMLEVSAKQMKPDKRGTVYTRFTYRLNGSVISPLAAHAIMKAYWRD